MVPPLEYSLDVAEPCLPSSQTCGLEDREPGRSWSGQRKEEEVPEGPEVPEGRGERLWEIPQSWMNLGKLLTRALVSPSVQGALVSTLH